jgi:hypothetical protein
MEPSPKNQDSLLMLPDKRLGVSLVGRHEVDTQKRRATKFSTYRHNRVYRKVVDGWIEGE